MKKHAFLIIAHHQFEFLEKLILLLDHPSNDIYCHISKSVKDFDFEKFSRLPKNSDIYFTDRIDVVWGGCSQIETELVLLKEASKKNYDYYHLLSGADLPIKKMSQIHDFFDQHSGKEFVHFCSKDETLNRQVQNRVRIRHLFKNMVGRNKNLLYYIDRIISKIQYYLRINNFGKRINNLGFGANWFSISDNLAKYVVERKEDILKSFKYSFCGDELFLQTIINESPFKDSIFVYDETNPHSYLNIMRYIDWERGTPYVFRNTDFDELISSPYLFARKFDLDVDNVLIDRLFNYFKNN